MALITAPASFLDRISRADITLSRVDFEVRSIFNRKRQVLAYPSGSHWRVELEWRIMDELEAGEWRAFYALLQGRANTFELPIPTYDGPSSGYSGPAGLVNGAGQTGNSLITDGWSNSTQIFRAGDLFTVNNELKIVTANVSSNGSGEATIPIEPPIRVPPANNAPLEIDEPYFICASDNSDQASWGLSPGRLSSFERFSGVEAY